MLELPRFAADCSGRAMRTRLYLYRPRRQPRWATRSTTWATVRGAPGSAIAVGRRRCPEHHHICGDGQRQAASRTSEHERIFEVFQTVAPRTDGRRSTGIGLAIVKKVAETFDGRAWVESEPGNGATFHVTPPPSSASPAARDRIDPVAHPRWRGQRSRGPPRPCSGRLLVGSRALEDWHVPRASSGFPASTTPISTFGVMMADRLPRLGYVDRLAKRMRRGRPR